jgi:hypothetical protein
MKLLKMERMWIDDPFTDAQVQAIERFAASNLPRPGQVDRSATTHAINDLYTHVGISQPKIFWCESPFQLAVMPFLLNVFLSKRDTRSHRMRTHRILNSGGRDEMRDALRQRLTHPLWRRTLSQLASQLDRETEFDLTLGGRSWEMLNDGTCIRDAIKHHYAGLTRDISQRLYNIRHSSFLRQVVEKRTPLDTRRQATLRQVQNHLLTDQGIVANDSVFSVSDWELCMFLVDHMSQEGLPAPLPRYHNIVAFNTQSLLEFQLTQLLFQSQHRVQWSSWCANDSMPLFRTPIECIDENFYDYCPLLKERIKLWSNFREAAIAYNPFHKVIFVCDFPTKMAYDERNALHCEDGPALSFADGYSLYSWRGVTIEPDVITHPNRLTANRVEFEQNAERRRVYMEIYGMSRFLLDTNARVISSDSCGTLYKKDMRGDEPVLMVRVTNSTAEPDGTYKDYFLRVPPDIMTAREAVAWTFGMHKDQYHPEKQT